MGVRIFIIIFFFFYTLKNRFHSTIIRMFVSCLNLDQKHELDALMNR